MHDFVKIENNEGLVRDMRTNAIVSTSSDKISDYRAKKIAAEQRDSIIKKNQEEINDMKKDISDIKEMLTQLLKGK